jgi:hypothetical protein
MALEEYDDSFLYQARKSDDPYDDTFLYEAQEPEAPEPVVEEKSNLGKVGERASTMLVSAGMSAAELAANQEETNLPTFANDLVESSKDNMFGLPNIPGEILDAAGATAVKGIVDLWDTFTKGDVRKDVEENNKLLQSEAKAILGDPGNQYTGNAAQKLGFEVLEGAAVMAPHLLAAYATRKPGVMLAGIGTQVAGQTYDEYMEKTGGDHDRSMAAVKFNVMAEVIPESIPVMAFTRKLGAGKALNRFLEGTLGEGGQEMLTEILQNTYSDMQLEGMSLKEALKNIDWSQVVHAGLIGIGVGGLMSAPGTAGDVYQGVKEKIPKPTKTVDDLVTDAKELKPSTDIEAVAAEIQGEVEATDIQGLVGSEMDVPNLDAPIDFDAIDDGAPSGEDFSRLFTDIMGEELAYPEADTTTDVDAETEIEPTQDEPLAEAPEVKPVEAEATEESEAFEAAARAKNPGYNEDYSPGVNNFFQEWAEETRTHPLDEKSRIVMNRDLNTGDDFAMVDVSPLGSDGIRLNGIQASRTGKGNGTAALDKVLEIAGRNGEDVTLNPKAFGTVEGGLTDKQLKDWYTRKGFIPSGSQEMVWSKDQAEISRRQEIFDDQLASQKTTKQEALKAKAKWPGKSSNVFKDRSRPDFIFAEDYEMGVTPEGVAKSALETAGQLQADAESLVKKSVVEGDFQDQVLAQIKAKAPLEDVTIKPTTRQGREVNLNIASTGQDLKAKMVVIEGDDLITSNDADGVINPRYPKELQPRDRNKGSSMLQIQKIAKNVKPELLGDNGQSNGGSPVIGADGVVESGNGRTIALMAAYKAGDAEGYRQYIIDNAAAHGLSGADIEGMNKPVLVRVRQGEMDMDHRAEFARQSNQTGTAPMTPTENARADSVRITDEDMAMYMPSESGNILAGSNQEFLKRFGSRLGDLEVGGLSTPDGRWTKQMADRVQAAVFFKAYGNESLLSLVAEEADPDVKNILSGLNQAAPAFARARSITEDLGDLDIISNIVESIDMIRDAKAKGSSIKQTIDQGGLFGDVDPVSGKIAEFLEDSARSSKRIGLSLSTMAQFLEQELNSQKQDGLFEMAPATKADLVAAANKQLSEVYSEKQTIDIFAEEANRPTVRKRDAESSSSGGQQAQVQGAETEATRPEVLKPATDANIQAIVDQGANYVPKSVVKAYKLFTRKKGEPNILYPLFVDADVAVPVGEWVLAHQGETKDGKVKSKIGHLANRPGWHSGDLPVAPQIGKKDPGQKAPNWRAGRQIWAEVEIPADIDWQTEANNRAETTKAGEPLPRTAHITDQIPAGGYYKYKTNPNQPGEWMISGAIKVNRILTDAEVADINSQDLQDLPRKMDASGNQIWEPAAMYVADERYVYHATFTDKTETIQKEGLQPFKTSNWKRQGQSATERYNEDGGVFAFERAEDAARWAFKMGYGFGEATSIIKAKRDGSWEADPSGDITLQMGKGKSLKRRGPVPPGDIVSATSAEVPSMEESGMTGNEYIEKLSAELEADAAQVKEDAEKYRFPDSKVVDKSGKLLTVYHGSKTKFDTFDFEKAPDGAFFFTDNKAHAEVFGNGSAKPYVVNITNPMTITGEDLETAWDEDHPEAFTEDGEFNDEWEHDDTLPRMYVDQFVEQAKKAGHDGLIIKEMPDFDVTPDMYLPFSPEQIAPASAVDKKTGKGVPSTDEGVYPGYEIPPTQGKDLNTVREGEAIQWDLFAAPALSSVETKAQIADSFDIEYEQKEVSQLRVGTTKIIYSGDAAHVFAPIRKHAQETFMVAVTDKNGEILNVIRHTVGTKDSSHVYPVDVIGAIAATEGAANYWMAHNHPSGMTDASLADNRITEMINGLADGMDINFAGHVIIGDGYTYLDMKSDTPIKGHPTQKIPPMIRSKRVSVTERILKKRTKKNTLVIDSPSRAENYINGLETDTGILLVNTRHNPIGVIALTRAEMGTLRDGKQVPRILKAINTTNASGGMVFAKTGEGIGLVSEGSLIRNPQGPLVNVGNYLATLSDGFRHLDTFYPASGGGLQSAQAQGEDIGSKDNIFFRRGEDPRIQRLQDQGFDTDTVWYHGTLSDIQAPYTDNELGFHVGNAKQANDSALRKSETGWRRTKKGADEIAGGENVVPVYVKAKKSLRTTDRGIWDPQMIVADAVDEKTEGFTQADRIAVDKIQAEAITKNEVNEWFVNLLKGKGYDSIVYLNEHEGTVGGFRRTPSGDSLILFDADQVRSVNAQGLDADSSDLLARRGDSYEDMKGLDLTYQVEVESTGKTHTMTVNAAQTMTDLDTRIQALEELRNCI